MEKCIKEGLLCENPKGKNQTFFGSAKPNSTILYCIDAYMYMILNWIELNAFCLAIIMHTYR